ncbi:hypothetical protein MO867_10215 [Microbulbifer sp. OS29]|uniref:Uncharacterized protein n=1 Tax=Microbulbifer okhotskensis TaxID=2926617 RepID=A0A9X2EM08_9GAMM|nr:hypothetical protein [Microbulbifer okhotskensis]MCO1334714.1 hypothetical protein [Microbulbifer okhotskensis]
MAPQRGVTLSFAPEIASSALSIDMGATQFSKARQLIPVISLYHHPHEFLAHTPHSVARDTRIA